MVYSVISTRRGEIVETESGNEAGEAFDHFRAKLERDEEIVLYMRGDVIDRAVAV